MELDELVAGGRPGAMRRVAPALVGVLVLAVQQVLMIMVAFMAGGGAVVVVAAAVSSPEEKVVPALFAFGDSLADAGNNNKLRTLAKANHPPYGQDLPSHKATGRFANGYTSLDYFAFKLGLPLTPIHSDPSTTGANLLRGVNFASAASGIQPYTGLNFGKVFSLDAQIQQFAGVKEQLVAMMGANATDRFLGKSIYFIVAGSNDWLNTYFFPGSPLPHMYTRPQFRDLLVAKLISQIKELLKIGARRMAIVGLPPFGCCPSQLRAYKAVNGTCVGWLNDLARDFNDHLRPQVLALADSTSAFAFIDTYYALLQALENPAAFGYTITDHACCGIGKYGGFLNCFQGFPVCDDAQVHLFWDAYHPTSKFNGQFLDLVWNNGPPYSYPYSGRQIIETLRKMG